MVLKCCWCIVLTGCLDFDYLYPIYLSHILELQISDSSRVLRAAGLATSGLWAVSTKSRQLSGALWDHSVRYPDSLENCAESSFCPTGWTGAPSCTKTCLVASMCVPLLEPGNIPPLEFVKCGGFIEDFPGPSGTYDLRWSLGVFFFKAGSTGIIICIPLWDFDCSPALSVI